MCNLSLFISWYIFVHFSLEQKLSQRRSKVSELKKKQEDTQRNVTMKEKEKNKLQKELVRNHL